MITQEIVDKLKSNEIPYGILKTKDWFTDEVDQFMKDVNTPLSFYDDDGKWKDKSNTTNRFSASTYRLKQEYVLPVAKEVYLLLPINTNGVASFVSRGINSDIPLSTIIECDKFIAFWYGTKEEFNDAVIGKKEFVSLDNDIIRELPNIATIPKLVRIHSILKNKLESITAKYVILKGKDYETN